jgi:hypothetical protein
MDRRWDDPPATMRKRGRKSVASLSVVAPDVRMQRPEPPAKLSAEEKAIWREIVAKVKPDWFWSSEHLLVCYVRTLAHERMLADWIKQTDKSNPHYLDLLRMHRTETMLCANLAGKLRLTPRSTVDRYAPKLASSLPKPWGEKPDEPPPAA